MPRTVYVVGGGLAGMMAASQLAKQGIQVRILEKSDRLGGKAGADLRNGQWEEHGYHIFPAWYLNVRDLLSEIGSSGRLIDLHKVCYLRRPTTTVPDPTAGAPPLHFIEFHELTSLRNLLRTARSGLLPLPDIVFSGFYIFELAGEPFKQAGFLDRISANGYLRSRFYANERLARLNHHFVLQASAIPNYEVSAMTLRKVATGWFRHPGPLVSILNEDLQTAFIAPFQSLLERRGVAIELGSAVQKLILRDGGIAGLVVERRAGVERLELDEGDCVIVATPPEVTKRFVDVAIYTAEERNRGNPELKALAELIKLQSRPMASLHAPLKHRLELPAEHVILFESKYELSFIDNARHWHSLAGRDTPFLSMIASNYEPLVSLPDEQAIDALLAELREYAPQVVDAIDRASCRLRSNVDAPLFINTVGSWSFRPNGRTRIRGLFVAGDYCRSDADLTTMEGTIESGMIAANDVLAHYGLDRGPEPRTLELLPRRVRNPLWWLGLAAILPLYLIDRANAFGVRLKRRLVGTPGPRVEQRAP